MWQCQTNWPGFVNVAMTRVTWPDRRSPSLSSRSPTVAAELGAEPGIHLHATSCISARRQNVLAIHDLERHLVDVHRDGRRRWHCRTPRLRWRRPLGFPLPGASTSPPSTWQAGQHWGQSSAYPARCGRCIKLWGHGHLFQQRQRARDGRRRERRDRRQGQELRRRRRVRRKPWADPELQDLPGRVRIGHRKVGSPGTPPPNGASGPTLPKT